MAFILKNHANGDDWDNIVVAMNSRKEPIILRIPEGRYTVVCKDGRIDPLGLSIVYGSAVVVPAQSAIIMHE